MAFRKNLSLILFISFLQLTGYGQSLLEDESIRHFEGFFRFHYLEDQDEIFMEVNNLETEFLYVSSLREGVGSNDLGLDRGQIGDSRIVYFKKAGNKLLLIQPNMKYRAITDNPLEKKSIEEAFAKSVLFGFPIMEKTESGYLINLTPFLLQDIHGVAKRLKDMKQGSYSPDLSRSAINLPVTKNFPKNSDFDVLITLTGDPSGSEIRSVVPDASHVTVFQHHSFVALPDDDYQPRKYHPNSGSYSVSFTNYSAPVSESMKVEYLVRHRLKKKDPNATVSKPVKPIIYYLDNGTPEPVRSALVEGASWWNQAFEAIGFKDAFQVKVLPDSIDPLDIRYHVIQWVHRSTRGWSYGRTVTDPRTGEIIKGHVSLGSLRVRQDYNIAQALTNAPFGGSNDVVPELMEFALSRIRQLSAHEVGHTLGFKHNFAASTRDRASVMDYPHPLITINNGIIDYSEAYASGIGSWDKVSVAYAYKEVNTDDELDEILNTAFNGGQRYVTDADARPQGGASAYGHLWDNGEDVIKGLNDVLDIRQKAISQFSRDNIREGQSTGKLEDLFVLLYFFHRYQTEAAVKLIGGVDYGYALKGEDTTPTKIVSASTQREAFSIILQTINANQLAVPEGKLDLFVPRSYGERDRESFKTMTGPTFDPLSAATTAADHTISLLLHPERINRLMTQKATDQSQLGLEEVIGLLLASSLQKKHVDSYFTQVQESINEVVLSHLMKAALDERSFTQCKDIINARLSLLLDQLRKQKTKTAYEKGRIELIERYFEDPDEVQMLEIPKIPDGSPIGTNNCAAW